MTIGIYKIENKVTGGMYIGQSVNIEKRWGAHKQKLSADIHENPYLQNAWNKYKEDNFKFEIIETFNEDQPFIKDVLNDSEEFFIKWYNTYEGKEHYNLTPGGDNNEHLILDYVRMSKGGYNQNKKQKYNAIYNKTVLKVSIKKEEIKKLVDILNENLDVANMTPEEIRKSDVFKKANANLFDCCTVIKDGKNKNNEQMFAIYYKQKKIKISKHGDKIEEFCEILNDVQDIGTISSFDLINSKIFIENDLRLFKRICRRNIHKRTNRATQYELSYDGKIIKTSVNKQYVDDLVEVLNNYPELYKLNVDDLKNILNKKVNINDFINKDFSKDIEFVINKY